MATPWGVVTDKPPAGLSGLGVFRSHIEVLLQPIISITSLYILRIP